MRHGRAAPAQFREDQQPAASDTGTDLQIAAALGGEYYFVPRFSNCRISGSNDGLFTSGTAFLRVYFK